MNRCKEYRSNRYFRINKIFLCLTLNFLHLSECTNSMPPNWNLLLQLIIPHFTLLIDCTHCHLEKIDDRILILQPSSQLIVTNSRSTRQSKNMFNLTFQTSPQSSQLRHCYLRLAAFEQTDLAGIVTEDYQSKLVGDAVH